MGRSPCCDKSKVKRGPWSPEEDSILKNYLHTYGTGGNWIALPLKAGLLFSLSLSMCISDIDFRQFKWTSFIEMSCICITLYLYNKVLRSQNTTY